MFSLTNDNEISTEISPQKIDADEHSFRDIFEQNIDASCVVPCYFVHRQEYMAKVSEALTVHAKQIEPRYDCIFHVARYFRAGEGIPQTVKLFFAEKLLKGVCNPKNFEEFIVNNNLSLPWQLRELYDDEPSRICNIPLYDPKDKGLENEYITLWEDDTIKAIQNFQNIDNRPGFNAVKQIAITS